MANIFCHEITTNFSNTLAISWLFQAKLIDRRIKVNHKTEQMLFMKQPLIILMMLSRARAVGNNAKLSVVDKFGIK